MRATVHDTIDEIGATEWDAVVGPERLYQSHAWLRSSEGGALVDCTPKYVVVRDGSGAIAATVAAYMIPTSLVMLSKGLVKAAAERIQRVVPWFLRPRILECGCPLGPGNGVSIRPGVAVKDVAPIICEALDLIAARARIHLIVLRDFLQSELEWGAEFEGAGYVRAESLPNMSLGIKWNSFEDYLGSMRSPHRWKVRRGLSLARNSGLHVRLSGQIGGEGARMARQRENVRALATEYNREQLTPKFFAQLDREFGSRARVLEVLRGTTPVAHALVIEDGGILRGVSFGRETGGVRDGAYFLVIASTVELAINEGKSVVDLGMTTHGPKTDFGAKMIPQWMLLRVRGPLGKLLPLALKHLNPGQGTVSRRVFRDEPKEQ